MAHEPRNILAIDPGKTTGIALWRPHQGHNSWEEPGGLAGVARLLNGWVEKYLIDTVVIEKFTIGAKKGVMTSQYDAVYLNGYVLGLEASGADFTVKQQPVTMVKTFATNAKLKKLGWYMGGEGHADDASRHLLTYLSGHQCGQELLERLI
tara:strand:- start:1626 stop:2078 length:453 start_codon:yes stop_codon:yes gene_type:complete